MEIQARELRIGNWVDYDFITTQLRGYVKLTADLLIDLLQLQQIDGDISIVKPIPLTGELLKRIGFTISKGWCEMIIKHEKLRFYSHLEVDKIWVELLDEYDGVLSICRNLHHMQNLHFALTQTELEINL